MAGGKARQKTSQHVVPPPLFSAIFPPVVNRLQSETEANNTMDKELDQY
jgi:hypothetical protein